MFCSLTGFKSVYCSFGIYKRLFCHFTNINCALLVLMFAKGCSVTFLASKVHFYSFSVCKRMFRNLTGFKGVFCIFRFCKGEFNCISVNNRCSLAFMFVFCEVVFTQKDGVVGCLDSAG